MMHFDNHNHRASRNESRRAVCYGSDTKAHKISSLSGQNHRLIFFRFLGSKRPKIVASGDAPSSLWKVIIIPTIVTGYAAALLLDLQCCGQHFGFTQWP